MKVIYKYPLAITDCPVVSLPKDATIVKVGNQGDSLFIWAVVDDTSEEVARNFRIFGTGHPIPDDESLIFIDTVLMPNGLVWHIFSLTPRIVLSL